MLPSWLLLSAIFIVFLTNGCWRTSQQDIPVDKDVITQVSTISALSAGLFEGSLSVGELKQSGDFGLGTFDALNGEMVQLDGEVYQIRDDGIAYLVDDSMKTPFSVVTFFDSDKRVNLTDPMECDQLGKAIDKLITAENLLYAVKVSGLFENVKTRSVPRQNEPFTTLSEALKGETKFELDSVRGTIVGFRFPSQLDGVNVAGYHFHFLTDDRKAGGHVLGCKTRDVNVEVDYSYQLNIKLPDSEGFYRSVR